MKPEHKAALDQFTATHKGKPLNQKDLLKPNTLIAKVLVARIASMSDEQQQAIKSIVTPQTKDALKILLPELSSVIEKGAAAPVGGAPDGGTEG